MVPTPDARAVPDGNWRGALASRNFRLLWLSQAVSAFGDKFTEIAVPVLIYHLTGSAVQLGLAFVVQTIGSFIFGLLAGAYCDRWNRRLTMIGSDLVRAALVALILGVLLVPATVTVKLVALYALVFAMMAVRQFFTPAKIATIPETVDERSLIAANSLDQGTMTFVGFAGYGAAGLLTEFFGTTTAFVIDGGTFLLSALLIVMMRLPASAPTSGTTVPSLRDSIAEGLRCVWDDRRLRLVVFLSLMGPLALGAIHPLLLLFAHRVLQRGDLGYGLIESAFALGLAFGIIVVGRLGERLPRERLLSFGLIGLGLGEIAAVGLPLLVIGRGGSPTSLLFALTLGLFFLSAAANGAIMLGVRTIVQERSPSGMIGRVYSVVTVVSSAAVVLGASVAGLADLYGVGPVIMGWALLMLLVGLLTELYLQQTALDQKPSTLRNIPSSTVVAEAAPGSSVGS